MSLLRDRTAVHAEAPTPAPRTTERPAEAPRGSVIVPAHDEEVVIGTLLAGLDDLVDRGVIEVVVACNGCTDGTARVARSHAGVRVLELAEPSKTAALNAGDALATHWPRLYLDADVAITGDAVLAVLAAVADGGALAARPSFSYDVDGCSAVVRAYYRARERGAQHRSGLWGAGAYALSREGHERLGRFPDVTADDLVVDAQFTAAEKSLPATTPVRVRAPRTLRSLRAVLRRQTRGRADAATSTTSGATVAGLIRGVRGPRSAADAFVYAALSASVRVGRRAPQREWERDESTRVAAPPAREEAPPSMPLGRFAPADGDVDIAAVVVTYNSADHIDRMIDGLRAETGDASIRLVVADNDSADGTLERVRLGHPDAITFGTGGNLGYAGGINAAMEHCGSARAILVLNPDIEIVPGCVRAMLDRLPRRGVVVPQILDGEGRITHSIRREPALGRALGDALLASRWKRRPDWLAETVYARHQYESAHRIDWATGAALLIDAKLAGELGPWDERYFLFSEETDYLRRARDAGASVWFEPAARIVHREGGSGRSPELNALSAVNRIRYIRAFHGRLYAAAFRSIAILAETVRLGRPGNAGALRMVTSEGRWRSLPHAPDRPSDRPTFGYLVPEFPGQTHAFFWREITALRNAGASPRLISTRPPRRALVPHSWASEAASETYYLGSLRLADVPRTTLALARSFRAGLPPFEARGVRGRLRMFVLRVAGSRLAVLARREGWSHVHVHSCGDSARIAAFARAAGGPSYSLTLHGPLSDYGGDQETKWSGAEFGLVITDRLKGEVMGALGDAVRTEPAIAPMGIDPEVFRPRVPEAPRPSHAPASIRIVSCGRLNPSKGHEVLIAAVIRLRDQGRDVTLDIAGEDDDGGTGYRRRLESIIGREHLTEAVTLHGAISERGVVDLLDDATVFALASRAEPLGVAIMEAMAVGVPVVAGNGGGVAELIDDGRTGILAAPGDPEAFAAAIARIADTPELAAALADRAREAVLARFDSRASAATLLSLVETSGRAA